MSTVIDLYAHAPHSHVPTVVLVDLQQEHVAAPRGLVIPEAETALTNCRVVLDHARAAGLPIAFVRRGGRGSPFFNRATRFYSWIDGFEPLGADMIFERDRPSCYANREFASVINDGGGHFVLAGFAGESACLSTAIDAFHRGHSVTYLADASASHAVSGEAGATVHRMVAGLVGLYAKVLDTQEWLSTAPQHLVA